MKAKTFENLIRKIVREEIDYALRREIKSLKEDLQENNKQQIVEQTPLPKEIKHSLKEKIMGSSTPNTHQQFQSKQFQPKQFTNNSTLNDLLNETAMGDTNLNSGHTPASMEGSFAPSGVGNMPMEAVPSAVADAVNRDYSGLMKAIDKKRNNK